MWEKAPDGPAQVGGSLRETFTLPKVVLEPPLEPQATKTPVKIRTEIKTRTETVHVRIASSRKNPAT